MFANGIHDAVKMLSGNESDEIRSIGLLRDMGADEFAVEFRKILPELGPEDEIIMFADIVGGSPLSTAANVIAEEGLLGKTLMIGGMNLPLVLTGVLSKDDMTFDEIREEIISDAQAGVKEFSVAVSDESADDDI
jgi:PTS system N-acetylgalactosamine-specific IIA component